MRFSYNQGADPRWTASDTIVSAANTVADANALSLGTSPIKWAPTLTSEGACQGISIWWLIKRAMNDDFWTWFGPPKCAAPSSTKAYGAAGAPVAAVKTVMQGQMRIALQGGDRATNHRAAINYILSNTTGHLTNKRGLVLRQLRPGEIVAAWRQELFIGKQVGDIGRRVLFIAHQDKVLHRLQRRPQRLDERKERQIEEQQPIFGVVEDVLQLLGEQARVDGVQHRADARDRVVQLQVAVGVDRQRRHPIARPHPELQERLGELLGAVVDGPPVAFVNRALQGPGKDQRLAVVARCVFYQ